MSGMGVKKCKTIKIPDDNCFIFVQAIREDKRRALERDRAKEEERRREREREEERQRELELEEEEMKNVCCLFPCCCCFVKCAFKPKKKKHKSRR